MRIRHDRTSQDLAVLTGLLHDLAGDLPPEHEQRLKDHLVAEIGRADPIWSPAPSRRHRTGPRRRARLVLSAGTLAAGAAAVTAIIIASQPGLPPASPGAVRLMAKVADAAARQPVPRVTNSQYMYEETKIVTWSVPSDLEPYITRGSLPRQLRLRLEKLRPQKSTTRTWAPVADVCRTGLMRVQPPNQFGRDQKFDARGSGQRCPNIGGLNDPTYRLLQTLPTDPHALLAMIYKVEQGHGPSPDQEAFVTISDLLDDMIAPPNVSAALYRAAALIPGVTLVPSATDAVGRHGVAIAQTTDGIRTELIFSNTTLTLLGERTVLARIGISSYASAIISKAFASRLGRVPPSTPNPAS